MCEGYQELAKLKKKEEATIIKTNAYEKGTDIKEPGG
jgi:hypothetical protein